MSIGIPPCITLNFIIIMGEKEHDGRHKGRLRRKAYVTGLSLAKATGGSWLKKWKATVTPDPNRPLRGNGSELDSPRDMFLGLSLRFKSDLRNSGRICLTAVRMETSLPFLIHHQNRETLMMINLLKFPGFGPPPWWGGSISKKSRSEAKHEGRQW